MAIPLQQIIAKLTLKEKLMFAAEAIQTFSHESNEDEIQYYYFIFDMSTIAGTDTNDIKVKVPAMLANFDQYFGGHYARALLFEQLSTMKE